MIWLPVPGLSSAAAGDARALHAVGNVCTVRRPFQAFDRARRELHTARRCYSVVVPKPGILLQQMLGKI